MEPRTIGASDFVTAAFGGVELGRVPLEDGSIGHGEIRVGDTVLLAFDQRDDWPACPSLLRIFVEDADATHVKALSAGAAEVTALATTAFGQRGSRVRDPFGNIWWITADIEDVDLDESMRRLEQPRYREQMRTAQETLDAELSGRTNRRSSAVADTGA